MQEAIGWARKRGHMASLSYTLFHACVLASLLRDTRWLTLLVDEAERITAEYRQRLWGAYAQRFAFLGRMSASDGEPDGFAKALKELEEARAFLRSSKHSIFGSFLDAATAGALIARGEMNTASALLADARRAIATTDEHWVMAEVHRVSGLLHLAQGTQRDAEAAFQEALDLARQQQAHGWQLRAATSLARLWADQGERQKARNLLASVYGWFTEGFDTADLKDAKVLLEELA
jgi:predicted ATPase